MTDIVKKISYAMSLRTPQQEALAFLDKISANCDYKKDSKAGIEAVASDKLRESSENPCRGTVRLSLFLLCYGNGYRQDPPDGRLHLLSL